MPKHYAEGVNVQRGTVQFDGTKTMNVWFPLAFDVVPSISLTLADVNNAPPYRTVDSNSKFTIKFQQPYNGKVTWIAMGNGGV